MTANRPRRRAAASILSLVLVSAVTAPTPLGRDAPDRGLVQAVRTLETGFAASSAVRLRAIMPPTGRVFLALPTLTARNGYFSPDQLTYVLNDMFQRHPVRGISTDQGTASENADDRVVVRGRLTLSFDRRDDRTIEVHFLFASEGERWTLRQIREQYRA